MRQMMMMMFIGRWVPRDQKRSNVPAAQAARTAEGDPHYDADEGLQTFIIIDVYCDDDARPLRQL